MSQVKTFFITGTDTEIGKTTIACGLLSAANYKNLTTAAIKPVASGCVKMAEGLRNDDAVKLWHNCSFNLSYDEVNPFAFQPAIAPHIAAKEVNQRLSVSALVMAIEKLQQKSADFIVVEGAGGWRVPLNEQEYLSGVAKELKLPVILVVGVKLGCVSHALLTQQAIENDGLSIVGWVANIIDPATERLTENLHTLQTHLNLPCLGTVPYKQGITAKQVADYLDISLLDRSWQHEFK